MHIDKNDLIEFDNGTMNEQELIEFLSHLDHCDSCLDQMIEQENHSPVTVPSYLAEQIWIKPYPARFSLHGLQIKSHVKFSFCDMVCRLLRALLLHCFFCSVFRISTSQS